MKQAVIKEFSTVELKQQLEEEKRNLAKLKMNNAVSPIENPLKIRESRRTKARMITELHARALKEGIGK